jgi:hypothetical protein
MNKQVRIERDSLPFKGRVRVGMGWLMSGPNRDDA